MQPSWRINCGYKHAVDTYTRRRARALGFDVHIAGARLVGVVQKCIQISDDGRLIRDFDDFGVIVVGDPRLKTKPYGRVFLDALPPGPVITDSAVAAEFLAGRLRALTSAMPAASRVS